MQWIEKITTRLGGTENAILLGVALCLVLLVGFMLTRIIYGVVCLLVSARAARKERKRKRVEQGKRLQYALPDKENAYVRAKLQSTLREEIPPLASEIEADKVGVRLRYARGTIAKIREAALSPVERLEVEEASKILAAYSYKERWSTEDIKSINELLGRLLKLSAKYEIAV